VIRRRDTSEWREPLIGGDFGEERGEGETRYQETGRGDHVRFSGAKRWTAPMRKTFDPMEVEGTQQVHDMT
jgi:hypothetical protein